MIVRQKLGRWLRNLYLLQLADRVMFLGDVLRTRKSNRLFLERDPDFARPPLGLAYDAYHNTDLRAYQTSGARHAELIAQLMREYLPGGRIRVCEWGCGPGRVIRHLTSMAGFTGVELYGSDLNAHTIEWCQQHLEGIDFRRNDLAPPLPFAANTLDCIYAISVVTHLSAAMHFAWINELRRVLKPNGILILTTHGVTTANRLLPDEKSGFDQGALIVRDRIREGKKHFLAYHPVGFVREHLLKDFLVLRHIETPTAYQLHQDVWVARKPGEMVDAKGLQSVAVQSE